MSASWISVDCDSGKGSRTTPRSRTDCDHSNRLRRVFLELELHCEILAVSGTDQRLLLYTAAPGSPSQRALRALRATLGDPVPTPGRLAPGRLTPCWPGPRVGPAAAGRRSASGGPAVRGRRR